MKLTLDTETQVFFYEQDFYVLSNFSSFAIDWRDRRFSTLEHAYHWEKFPGSIIADHIHFAKSAHEAFKIAEQNKATRREDWDEVKVEIMRRLLWAKVNQHEYVKRKLLSTGSRELIENSWRDDFWGWAEDRKGKNVLGRLWMEIRDSLNFKP